MNARRSTPLLSGQDWSRHLTRANECLQGLLADVKCRTNRVSKGHMVFEMESQGIAGPLMEEPRVDSQMCANSSRFSLCFSRGLSPGAVGNDDWTMCRSVNCHMESRKPCRPLWLMKCLGALACQRASLNGALMQNE